MHIRALIRAALALAVGSLVAANTRALISVGGANPVPNQDWPAGSEKLANLPSRFSYWEGPPFGGGNYHFEYRGDTAEFQAALDTFAGIDAVPLELMVYVYDGDRTSIFSHRPVLWEFEVWSRQRFYSLYHSTNSISLSMDPWFGQPLPAPSLSIWLGTNNPVNWTTVRVPKNVALLDRRVATSSWSASTGGVVRATIHDMATGRPLPGAILEVGYQDRVFQLYTSTVANADGVALLQNLPAGGYAVRGRRDGYATRQIGGYQNHGRTLGLFDDASLAPAATLKGRVTDTAGRPLENVGIGVQGLVGLDGTGYVQNLYNEGTTARTDTDGRFILGFLPRGQISLRVRKPGYHWFSFKPFPLPGEELTIVMTNSGKIRGTVSGAAGLPEGQKAYVEVKPVGEPIGRWSGPLTCEPDGSFRHDEVPADTYTLTPFVATPHQGGFSVVVRPETQPSREVTLEPGQQLDVTLELKLKP